MVLERGTGDRDREDAREMVDDGMAQEPIGAGELAQLRCSCWVSYEPEEVRFSIRYGAHHLDCPVYRPSGDPLDNLRDAELRNACETG